METAKYSPAKTAIKGAAPLAVLVVAWALRAAAARAGVAIDESTSYQVAILGYGAFLAFVNWLKNRKRGQCDLKPN